jgi:hypothetical protein
MLPDTVWHSTLFCAPGWRAWITGPSSPPAASSTRCRSATWAIFKSHDAGEKNGNAACAVAVLPAAIFRKAAPASFRAKPMGVDMNHGLNADFLRLNSPKLFYAVQRGVFTAPSRPVSASPATFTTPCRTVSSPSVPFTTPRRQVCTPKPPVTTSKLPFNTPRPPVHSPKPPPATPNPPVTVYKIRFNTPKHPLNTP